jgi:hypothetical protein
MTLGRFFVDRAIEDVLRRSGCADLPDLVQVARTQNVQAILLRDIFSDGALETVKGGFRIYLKSPTEGALAMTDREPPLPVRTRFTLAHEIAHTFFYGLPRVVPDKSQEPKPLREKPRASDLERLCQYGAASLLVPATFLRSRHQSQRDSFEAPGLIDLSGELRVSLEALLRRLNELDEFTPTGTAQLLIERSPDSVYEWRIIASRLGQWFSAVLGRPRAYSALSNWLRQDATTIDEVVKNTVPHVRVAGHRVVCTTYSHTAYPVRKLIDCQHITF